MGYFKNVESNGATERYINKKGAVVWSKATENK